MKTNGDNGGHTSSTTLLDLPAVLLVHTLGSLEPRLLGRATCVCRELHALGTAIAQYAAQQRGLPTLPPCLLGEGAAHVLHFVAEQAHFPRRSLAAGVAHTLVLSGTHEGPFGTCERVLACGGSPALGGGRDLAAHLGQGEALGAPVPIPTPVKGLDGCPGTRAVCCGAEASLLLDEQGAVWSWGADWAVPTATEERRSRGQLPQDAVWPPSAPPVRLLPLPRRITPLWPEARVVQLSCGFAHALALTCEGTLFSFGARSAAGAGALGREVATYPVSADAVSLGLGPPLGDRVDLALARTPGRVGGLLVGRRVLQASAGGRGSLALTVDGGLYSWGRGRGVALRQPSVVFDTPAMVAGCGPDGNAFNGARLQRCSMGEAHCLALTTSGQLLAWGQNRLGELCLGDTLDRDAPCVAGPLAALREGDGLREAVAGALRSALLTVSGELLVAGRWAGGAGFESINWVPQTLPSLVGIRLVEVALGATHAVVRAEDGTIYTLGACLAACGHEGEHGFEYLG